MAKSTSILVIGGYGHIGRFLVPRLVQAGWQVTVLTRGKQAAPDAPAWRQLPHHHVAADVQELVERFRWADLLRDVAPAAVIDILARNAPAVVKACPPGVQHVIVCGSLWMYGPPRQVPTPERTQGPFPFEFYRTRYQHLQDLLAARDQTGPVVTAVMPSNICGPGKIPIDPYGGRSLDIHLVMAAGKQIVLPADGQMLVGPTDAQDVAEVFALALEKPEASAWQMFNAASAYALTYADLVTAYSHIYGVEIPVRAVTWPEFDAEVKPDPVQRYHHEAHMCADITAARRTLGYEPRYTPEESLRRAVEWMREKGLVPRPARGAQNASPGA